MVINPGLRALLDCIGQAEAGKRGYDALYLPAERKLGRHALTRMTLGEVQALQVRMKKSGSSACGRYQFLHKTLGGLMRLLRLKSSERFTPALQDRLAVHLMIGRGLHRFIAGSISAEEFANGLAQEWASLPVVTPINGKRVGQSYYAGDGLNHALVKPGTILLLLNGLVASPPDVEPLPKPDRIPDPNLDMRPLPEPAERNPVKRLGALIAATLAGAAAWLSEHPVEVAGGIAVAAALIAFIVWRSRK